MQMNHLGVLTTGSARRARSNYTHAAKPVWLKLRRITSEITRAALAMGDDARTEIVARIMIH